MVRHAALHADSAHRRRRADRQRSSPAQPLRALRLSADTGPVEPGRIPGGQGPGAAHKRWTSSARAEGCGSSMACACGFGRSTSNHVWSSDFMIRMTHDGGFRLLTLLDEFSREYCHPGG